MLRGCGGRHWGALGVWLLVSGCLGPGGGSGSGGATGSTGGSSASGGNTATSSGGASSGGATAASGGAVGSGGTQASGGVTGSDSGGAVGATGGSGAGGVGGAGTVGTGGSAGGAAGGTAGRGGSGAGGAGGRGGTAGGSAGTTGAGGAGGSGTCTPPRAGTGGTRYCTNMRGELSSGYAWERWAAGQGSGCMTVWGVNANYSATWTDASDFLARAGLRFDSTKTHTQLGTISADFSEAYTILRPVQGATSKIYVSLYGWTIDPLTEYYVIDDYGDFVPGPINSDGTMRTNYGTITVDDGTYDIWAMPVKNRPAITGDNKDFTQIFSVRKVRRSCGHISLTEHFTKWASVGLPLGKVEEAMFLMEAQNNSGSIDVTATVTVK